MPSGEGGRRARARVRTKFGASPSVGSSRSSARGRLISARRWRASAAPPLIKRAISGAALGKAREELEAALRIREWLGGRDHERAEQEISVTVMSRRAGGAPAPVQGRAQRSRSDQRPRSASRRTRSPRTSPAGAPRLQQSRVLLPAPFAPSRHTASRSARCSDTLRRTMERPVACDDIRAR